MKVQGVVFALYVLVAIATASSVLKCDENELKEIRDATVEDDDLWRIPKIDGTFAWMTEQQAKELTLKTEISSGVKLLNSLFQNKRSKVRFALFTQNNPVRWQEIDMDRPEALKMSYFNASHPTRIFAHGWLGGLHFPQTYEIVDSHLFNGRRENYNVIIVDWSVWSMTVNYYFARLRTRKAGAKVAELIDWLHEETGMPFETLHVYGHSLGAHVAGFTGKQVTKGKIRTIVGLDPAMPLFRYKNPQNRLASTDAEYVETIQTNGRELGFYNPIGDSAFYPNGGLFQPGCGKDYLGGCAHSRAPTYLAEAIAMGTKNSFFTVKCGDFMEMRKKNCSDESEVRMGDPNNYKYANGVYFLKTTESAPFGLGKHF